MNAVIADHSPVAIWKRTIQPERASFAPAEARAVLRLRLSPLDLGRADELAAKARAGGLAAEEERGKWTTMWLLAALWSFLSPKPDCR